MLHYLHPRKCCNAAGQNLLLKDTACLLRCAPAQQAVSEQSVRPLSQRGGERHTAEECCLLSYDTRLERTTAVDLSATRPLMHAKAPAAHATLHAAPLGHHQHWASAARPAKRQRAALVAQAAPRTAAQLVQDRRSEACPCLAHSFACTQLPAHARSSCIRSAGKPVASARCIPDLNTVQVELDRWWDSAQDTTADAAGDYWADADVSRAPQLGLCACQPMHSTDDSASGSSTVCRTAGEAAVRRAARVRSGRGRRLRPQLASRRR